MKDEEQYVTIKTLIIACFAIMTPVVTGLSYFVSNSVDSSNAKIQLQLLPIIAKSKQNELRIVRIENSQLQAQKDFREALDLLRELKTDLKYNFVTKKEFMSEMDKKVDNSRINKQYLTK